MTKKLLTALLAGKFPRSVDGIWFIYAIECDDGSVYIGQTVDLENRWKQHSRGKGARWTKLHKPLQLFYYEKAKSFNEAWHRERELKKRKRHWLKKILQEIKGTDTKIARPKKKPKRIIHRKKISQTLKPD